MYHIVASDLDGTLLSPDHRLTPYTRETLKLLTERGIHFVFATGRHHIDVSQMRDSLQIDAFMITSNGARVHNTAGELIFSHNLEENIVRELCTLAYHDEEILTNIYRNDEWYLSRHHPEEKKYFQESVFNYRLFTPDLLETDGVSKLFFTCDDPEKLVPLEEAIVARWGDWVNVSFSFPTCLEVMAGGVSKGHALAEVTRLLGYELRHCVAFGDGMNDWEMLTMAGKGFIMRNAHQRLKDSLPELEIIGSNREDAVPQTLRKLFLA